MGHVPYQGLPPPPRPLKLIKHTYIQPVLVLFYTFFEGRGSELRGLFLYKVDVFEALPKEILIHRKSYNKICSQFKMKNVLK